VTKQRKKWRDKDNQ